MNGETLERSSDPRIALFNLGFRPFFLLAGLTASLLLSLWNYAYTGGHIPFGYYRAVVWHAHEMVFGYTVAVIAGFLLTAVRNWTGIPTPGGIGTLTLGMMARVALGHTGRELRVGAAMTWSFALANLAGVSRVLLPLLSPGRYSEWIALAGVLWTVAFTLFVISYASVLIQPRVDGRPG
jgi:uncharacterized protein involved in response to NO